MDRELAVKVFDLFKGRRVIIKRTDFGKMEGILLSFDPETKTIYTNRGKISTERIHYVKGTFPVSIEKLPAYGTGQEKVIGKKIFYYHIGSPSRKEGQYLGDYVYQLLIRKGKEVKLIPKVRLVGYSLAKFYPRELIGGKVEEVSYPEPGAWREDYAKIFSIIEEETEEGKVYEAEFLLRDGRTVRGFAPWDRLRWFMWLKLFSTPELKNPSLVLFTHAVEDLLNLEKVGEVPPELAKKSSADGGENKKGGNENEVGE